MYFDEDANAVKYAVKSNDSWSIETVDASGGMFPSLALDQAGNPHISYYKRVNGDMGIVQYATLTDDSWAVEEVDALALVPISVTGARRVTAIQLDHNNTVHISYGDRNVVKYARLVDKTWVTEIVVDFSLDDAELGAQTDLALDADGNPHITYFILTSLGPLNGNIQYGIPRTFNKRVPIS